MLWVLFCHGHLKRKHEDTHKHYEDHMKSCKLRSMDSASGQSSLTSYIVSGDTYGGRHPEQVRKTWSFIENCIVSVGLPLSVVENESFVHFLHDMDSKFKLPSRHQITDKYLPQLMKQLDVAISKKVAAAAHISLTVDIWTDRKDACLPWHDSSHFCRLCSRHLPFSF